VTPHDRIWLVRHAPTAWTGQRWCGRSDPELTPSGVAAAAMLAAELAVEVPTGAVVVTSPLRRALATADAIAAAIGAGVVLDPDLIEVDFGSVDGLTWDELAAAHPAVANSILAGDDPDWPDGERAVEVARRARAASTRIADLTRSGAVVVVSHGGLLRALAIALGGDGAHLAAASAIRLAPTPIPIP
jgi:ribonuclease H / adenosylcobalamin/alpha-ribazole phosphatase